MSSWGELLSLTPRCEWLCLHFALNRYQQYYMQMTTYERDVVKIFPALQCVREDILLRLWKSSSHILIGFYERWSKVCEKVFHHLFLLLYNLYIVIDFNIVVRNVYTFNGVLSSLSLCVCWHVCGWQGIMMKSR